MAEHDSDRGDREPDEQGVPFDGAPLDEDAAWAAIVAGYGEEPPDPEGTEPFRPVEDLALPAEDVGAEEAGGDDGTDPEEPAQAPDAPKAPEPVNPKPLGGSISFAPGVGPRDYTPAEPSDDDFDEDDEGHFVPPEPPPLPEADTTAKFAWLAVIGGPVLMLLAVILGWDMTWWLATLGIGGFLGGFVTLVARMKTDDEGDDDPGRGAVV